MNTQFKNTAEAAAHLAEDPKVAEEVRAEVAASELLSALVSMRISKGLTQEQISQSMGCDPSTVSRIESGSGRELKWSDIVGYVDALPNVQMCIMFDDQSLPPATRIKQCVFKIDEDLKRLVQIAQQFDGDEQITGKINRFYREVLFNFLARFTENRERLSSFISIPPKEQATLPARSAEQCANVSAYPVLKQQPESGD